jgi:Protein of unknown function (DUF418)/Heparan-alpha-glucosaminide N-acetyltransferase, catalytic
MPTTGLSSPCSPTPVTRGASSVAPTSRCTPPGCSCWLADPETFLGSGAPAPGTRGGCATLTGVTAAWPAPDPTTALVAASAEPTERRARVEGVDLARALAIAGMLVAHFVLRDRPGPLDSVRAFVDGRAMPLFVLLAGVSITLLTRRARHPDRTLLVRAAVFLPLGLALQEWTVGIAIILQYYALYYVVAVGLRRLGDRALLAVAAAVTAAAGVTIQLLGPRWPGYTTWDGGHGLLPPWGLLANVAVNGYYPFLPAGAFLCVGMWLGRRDLGDARLALRLVVVGLVLALTGYVGVRAIGDRLHADGITTGADGLPTVKEDRVDQVLEVTSAPSVAVLLEQYSNDADERRGQLHGLIVYAESRSPAFHAERLLDAGGHSEMPAWVLGATGTSLVALGGCLLLVRRAPGPLVPLVDLGQLSFTAYVAQALIIRWTPSVEDTTIGQQFGIATAVLAGLVAFAWLWRRWRRRGPLEALLHLVAHP